MGTVALAVPAFSTTIDGVSPGMVITVFAKRCQLEDRSQRSQYGTQKEVSGIKD